MLLMKNLIKETYMKYNDKIRVTSGFYEGMEWTIFKKQVFTNEEFPFFRPNDSIKEYVTYIICTKDASGKEIVINSFKESDLELIK